MKVLDVQLKDDTGSLKTLVEGGKFYAEIELAKGLTKDAIKKFLCENYQVQLESQNYK
jgi:hypothetical protein